MANVKEQSAALKSKQTKLLKKSKKELIEIVLRKDKIEKNQVNQISNLKREINSLQSRIKGFIADSEGDNNTICELREKLANAEDLNKALNENINSNSHEIEEIKMQFDKTIYNLKEKVRCWSSIAITFIIWFIVTLISYFVK